MSGSGPSNACINPEAVKDLCIGFAFTAAACKKRRPSALGRERHQRFPLTNPIDVLRKPSGNLVQFVLGGIDAGHATDACHPLHVERIQPDTSSGYKLHGSLRSPRCDRIDDLKAFRDSLPIGRVSARRAFVAAHTAPALNLMAFRHAVEQVVIQWDSLEVLSAELRLSTREPTLPKAQIQKGGTGGVEYAQSPLDDLAGYAFRRPFGLYVGALVRDLPREVGTHRVDVANDRRKVVPHVRKREFVLVADVGKYKAASITAVHIYCAQSGRSRVFAARHRHDSENIAGSCAGGNGIGSHE